MRGDPKRLMTADQFEKELVEDATRELRNRGYLVIEPRNIRRAYLLELAESVKVRPGYLEADGLRDPDNPCPAFLRGEPKLIDSGCDGDGHYLCRKCTHWKGKSDD
jgi:hypothetical protein